MYRFKKSLIALTGALTLVAIVTVAVPHIGRGASGTSNSAPTSQTQNVNVVNTPSVNAQQSGTWNVGITGTPVVGLDAGNNTVKFDAVNNTVKIDPNNPLSVRDVDNPAWHPFAAQQFGSWNDGAQQAGDTITTVPIGKRLVIEYVSVKGAVLTGQKMLAPGITLTTGGVVVSHYLTTSAFQGVLTGRDIYVSSQEVRLFADQGTEVFGFAFRDSSTGNGGNVTFTISGYLVDMP